MKLLHASIILNILYTLALIVWGDSMLTSWAVGMLGGILMTTFITAVILDNIDKKYKE